MKLNARLRMSSALITLTALLAACGTTPSSPTLAPGPTQALVKVELDAGLGTSAAPRQVTPQGIPFAEDGTPAVQTVRIRVFDGSRQPVLFDGRNVQQVGGSQAVLELKAGQGPISVQLVPGTYTFQSAGLASAGDTPLLAFGVLPDQTVGGSAPNRLNLPLRTLIGGQDSVTLSSLLPVTSVVPGQTLTLMLNVQTPRTGSAVYQVPLSDYDVTYAVQDDQGSVLNSSKLGTQVAMRSVFSSASVNVDATVSGLTAQGPEMATATTLTARFTRPLLSASQLGADLERPKLSLCSGAVPLVSGLINDNVGVARVQVYKGPVLVASTNFEDQQNADVKAITVRTQRPDDRCVGAAPSDAVFSVDPQTLRTDVPTQDLTIIVSDTAGNETRATAPAAQQRAPVGAAERAHALALSGASAATIMTALKSEFGLTADASVPLLRNENFAQGPVAEALKAVYESSASQAVQVLQGAGYFRVSDTAAWEGIARLLKQVYTFDASRTVELLNTFGVLQTSDTATWIALGNIFKDVYNLPAQQAVDLIQTLKVFDFENPDAWLGLGSLLKVPYLQTGPAAVQIVTNLLLSAATGNPTYAVKGAGLMLKEVFGVQADQIVNILVPIIVVGLAPESPLAWIGLLSMLSEQSGVTPGQAISYLKPLVKPEFWVNGWATVYGLDVNQAVPLLHASNYSYTEIGAALKQGYQLSMDAVASTLKEAGASADEISRMAQSVFNASATTVAATLRQLGYGYDTVAHTLTAVYHLSKSGIAGVLSGLGTDANTIADVLVYALGATDTEMASALRSINADFATIAGAMRTKFSAGYDRVARVLTDTFQLSKSQVADTLNKIGATTNTIADVLVYTLNATDTEMAGALKSIGADVKSITSALKNKFNLGYDLIGRLLKDSLGFTLAQVAEGLNSIGANANTIADVLRYGLNATNKEMAGALRSINTSFEEIASALKNKYGSSSAEVASILKNLSATILDIASILKNTFNLGYDAVFNALEALGFSLNDIVATLKSLF